MVNHYVDNFKQKKDYGRERKAGKINQTTRHMTVSKRVEKNNEFNTKIAPIKKKNNDQPSNIFQLIQYQPESVAMLLS